MKRVIALELNHLNLARLYRASQFHDVIGQDLAVKMLQNSLYMKRIFPVYLLSGKHGCGKTSLARIFAAAVNCDQLDSFCVTPKMVVVPCRNCDSCRAMNEGSHVDYIEIDAASHTGVEMVRSIIDSASFMPVLGKKKVYLIDEAHMLSKAAFNALLKLLEEPPKTVFFMLATTDVYKIPDTIRSRSFQLLLKPIASEVLRNYLEKICTDASISFVNDGLQAIVDYAGGSVRDALNVLERVRCAAELVDAQHVREVVGFVDDSLLCELLVALCNQDIVYFENRFNEVFTNDIAVGLVWNRLVAVIHAIITIKVTKTNNRSNGALYDESAGQLSLSFLYELLNQLFIHEPLLLKTASPYVLFRWLMYTYVGRFQGSNTSKPNSDSASAVLLPQEGQHQEVVTQPNRGPVFSHSNSSDLLSVVVAQLFQSGNELVASLLQKASVEIKSHVITISFAKDEEFVRDLCESHRPIWMPIYKEFFGDQVSVIVECSKTLSVKSSEIILPTAQQSGNLTEKKNNITSNKKEQVSTSATSAAMSDEVKAVLAQFPGKLISE